MSVILVTEHRLADAFLYAVILEYGLIQRTSNWKSAKNGLELSSGCGPEILYGWKSKGGVIQGTLVSNTGNHLPETTVQEA